MQWKWLFVLVLLCTSITVGWAEGDTSSYAGQEGRVIKAFSEEEIQGYISGSGMGFAKAAELNHYPGPLHVLELAEELQLSADQVGRTRTLFEEMKGKAVRLGEELVEMERRLDSLFAEAEISEGQLQRLVTDIAVIQGRLRFVHLRAHLVQREILTPDQIRHYDKLRGYGTSHQKGHHHHDH